MRFTPFALVFLLLAIQFNVPAADGQAVIVERHEYNFGTMVVQDSNLPGYRYPVAIEGSVHYPSSGASLPVALFMHGRHGTCAIFGIELFGLQHLCLDAEPVTDPVDSYTGYDYLAEDLAARGFVVISASANHINDRDLPGSLGLGAGDGGSLARAQLIIRTLEEFENLNDQACECSIGSDLLGRQDFTRVGLMGHSRGGEGVNHATQLNAQRVHPFGVQAVFALAPTNFNFHTAPNVAHATLLPYCDGDVSDLQGAGVYDDSRYLAESSPAPKYQFLVLGANHNFYNTIWTSDDASFTTAVADDRHCGAEDGRYGWGLGRLTPEDQRRTGLVLVNGFFRLHLAGDHTYSQVLNGASPMPAEGCPGGVPPCDVLHASYHAPAGDRLVVEDVADDGALSQNDLGGASVFTGFARATTCDPRDCPSQPNIGHAHQLTLDWDGPATWATQLPGSNDVSGFDVVSFRFGVNHDSSRNPNGVDQDLRIVLTDALGLSSSVVASAHSEALFDPLGTSAAKLVLNTVQVPMASFVGVNLGAIVKLELVFDQTASGSIQLADLMFQDLQ